MPLSIVLASGNQGKLSELQQLLAPLDATQRLNLITQTSLGISDAKETGLTFIENAIIKARHASAISGLPALADDSGLSVDALQGAPGIYSARYAEQDSAEQKTSMGQTDQNPDRAQRDSANNQKLLRALRDIPDAQRTARFYCVLVYLRHTSDPAPLVCQGSWQGYILHQPQGEGGFGYDPLFFVPGLNCSAAQLAPEQKNRVSHRGQAMQLLLQQWQNL
jgi:XTP/dITP diphosphohydrolase